MTLIPRDCGISRMMLIFSDILLQFVVYMFMVIYLSHMSHCVNLNIYECSVLNKHVTTCFKKLTVFANAFLDVVSARV